MLMAAYEMNTSRNAYQSAIIAKCKALRPRAQGAGLDVQAIPPSTTPKRISHRLRRYGTGPEVAERLEENNVIVNYQATPEEEGFTASGALRMGVSEMTRFGFGPAEFDELASLMADCILRGKDISEDVVRLRSRFTSGCHCNTAIGILHCEYIIYTITSHGNRVFLFLERPDYELLLFRRNSSKYCIFIHSLSYILLRRQSGRIHIVLRSIYACRFATSDTVAGLSPDMTFMATPCSLKYVNVLSAFSLIGFESTIYQ